MRVLSGRLKRVFKGQLWTQWVGVLTVGGSPVGGGGVRKTSDALLSLLSSLCLPGPCVINLTHTSVQGSWRLRGLVGFFWPGVLAVPRAAFRRAHLGSCNTSQNLTAKESFPFLLRYHDRISSLSFSYSDRMRMALWLVDGGDPVELAAFPMLTVLDIWDYVLPFAGTFLLPLILNSRMKSSLVIHSACVSKPSSCYFRDLPPLMHHEDIGKVKVMYCMIHVNKSHVGTSGKLFNM